MKLTLISAILWTISGICFMLLAISTFILGGAIWLGILQAFTAIINGINAGLHWKNWRFERKVADLWDKF